MKDRALKSLIVSTMDLIPNYKRVYSLGGYNPKDDFCKYLPFKRLKSQLQHGYLKLSFVSPMCWADPFERLYFDMDYSKFGFSLPSVRCFCVSEDSATTYGADAMWLAYGVPDDKVIRVTFKSKNILYALDKYAQDNDCQIVLSRMDYEYSRKKLEDHKPLEAYGHREISIDDYLLLLSLKRKAFSYEQEIRFFLISKKEMSSYITYVEVPSSTDVIKKITIAPVRPFSFGDPRKDVYEKYCKLENKTYRDALKKLFPAVPIKNSTVYKGVKS